LIVERGCEVETTIAGGFERAVAAAQAADVVLLAIGESQDMTGEAKSRTDIGIPPVQQRLAEAIAATGKPTVVLLRHGRAIALEGVVATPRPSWPPGSWAARWATPSPTCCSARSIRRPACRSASRTRAARSRSSTTAAPRAVPRPRSIPTPRSTRPAGGRSATRRCTRSVSA
jgi:hypothetical protein